MVSKRHFSIFHLWFAVRKLNFPEIEVQSKTASFSCYDPAVAERYDDFYMRVYFKSLNNQGAADVLITRYRVIFDKLIMLVDC